MHSYPKTRLFVESALFSGASVICEDKQAHYLSRVLRVKPGEQVALFNGAHGEWRAAVTHIDKKTVSLQVADQLQPFLPPPDIWLCFAPIKFGRIDYLVQKATELGAARLQPVFTEYTQTDRVNRQRLHANAVEAAEQCERVEVPAIDEPLALPALLADWPADRVLLYGDESGAGVALTQWLAQAVPPARSPSPASLCLKGEASGGGAPQKYAVLIGPEGGFSDSERHILSTKATGVGLGPRILRADTAAIALLSIVQCWLGDWQHSPSFRQAAPGREEGEQG